MKSQRQAAQKAIDGMKMSQGLGTSTARSQPVSRGDMTSGGRSGPSATSTQRDAVGGASGQAPMLLQSPSRSALAPKSPSGSPKRGRPASGLEEEADPGNNKKARKQAATKNLAFLEDDYTLVAEADDGAESDLEYAEGTTSGGHSGQKRRGEASVSTSEGPHALKRKKQDKGKGRDLAHDDPAEVDPFGQKETIPTSTTVPVASLVYNLREYVDLEPEWQILLLEADAKCKGCQQNIISDLVFLRDTSESDLTLHVSCGARWALDRLPLRKAVSLFSFQSGMLQRTWQFVQETVEQATREVLTSQCFEFQVPGIKAQARLTEVPYILLSSSDLAAIEPKNLEGVFTASNLLAPKQLNECDEVSKGALEAQARQVFDTLCQSLFSRLQSSSRPVTNGSLHLTLTAALTILDGIYPTKQGANTFIQYQREKLEYVSQSLRDPAVAGTLPSLFDHSSTFETLQIATADSPITILSQAVQDGVQRTCNAILSRCQDGTDQNMFRSIALAWSSVVIGQQYRVYSQIQPSISSKAAPKNAKTRKGNATVPAGTNTAAGDQSAEAVNPELRRYFKSLSANGIAKFDDVQMKDLKAKVLAAKLGQQCKGYNAMTGFKEGEPSEATDKRKATGQKIITAAQNAGFCGAGDEKIAQPSTSL